MNNTDDVTQEEIRAAKNAYNRELRAKNREKSRAYDREWNKKHPGKRKEYLERFFRKKALQARGEQKAQQNSR